MTDAEAFRRIAAPHEAAHLAGAYLLLGPTSIVGDAELHVDNVDALGHVEIDPAISVEELADAKVAALVGQPPDPELRNRIEGFAIALLAGRAYELAILERAPEIWDELPPSAPWMARRAEAAAASGKPAPPSDSEVIDALLLAASASDLEAFAWRSWLDQRTFMFVYANRRFRAIAEALTVALDAAGRMTPAEITHCAYRALNPPTDPHPATSDGYYE